LRAAREAAGVSLSGTAERAHYSKPYLGLVKTQIPEVRLRGC
jgi:hypothetical protein